LRLLIFETDKATFNAQRAWHSRRRNSQRPTVRLVTLQLPSSGVSMFYPPWEDVLVRSAIYGLKVIISTQSIKATSGEA